MIWSVSFSPLVPLAVLLAGAAVALVLSALGGVMRMRGWLLRALAMALVLLALANPAVEREDREPLSSVVALVVDKSQSQTLADRTTTAAAAAETLKERIAALPGFELRVIEAQSSTGSDGTALFGALSDGLSDVSPDRIGGAVLITDGQVHDVPANASALGFNAPVHALVTGTADEFDRRLALQRAPRFGLVGSEQVVTLRLADSGAAQGETDLVRIDVRRDGETVSQRFVSPGQTIDIPVDIAHGGNNIFEFEAESLAGELTTVNNRVVVTIDGIRENLRVLLVSGSPHAGERTWRNLLKSDASVDLVHFTILRPPEKQDGTPISELSLIAFPTRELFSVKIDEFDLIIFDRYERRGVLPMLYFDNIARYVREGGAVLIAGGPDYAEGGSLYRTPLAPILPARPTGRVIERPFHAQISDLGDRHPVTRGLPGGRSDPPDWSRWFRAVDAEVTAGEVLMTGPDQSPLLVLNREEEGRVALLLSDHVWLWARGFEGGGPHVPLLRRLAHWLMKEPDLEEEALRLSMRGSELVVERQTLEAEVTDATVTAPSGRDTRLTFSESEPGLWRASMPTTELGLYTVTDGSRTTLIHVGPQNPREFADVLSTTERLAPVTAATGGSATRLRDVGGDLSVPRIVPLKRAADFSGNGWIGLRTTEASILKGIDRYPLFIGLFGLALLLGALSLVWYREGR
ncbi:membrane protein [Polymorphum gilvum]|uniref:Conserved hypothetical transmembrane protein n=1 Tax=Polymorphum gilvum (strain LMG 25793 / CGMCC 1.9160 / SL003B-26A1) TaxID=991905 RepID=F2IZM9_POLGS|nr:membrane protein [Polymorphum gilvum]ADZ69586.1 Conserved hypothetical transmembrane protein [Polymorphum gilvum SL003B-26A1]